MGRMTFAQVMNAYAGYLEREAQRTEAQNKIAWESVRWQTWVLYNIEGKKVKPIRNVFKMLKLSWDKPKRITDKEREDLENINNSFPKYLKDGNK